MAKVAPTIVNRTTNAYSITLRAAAAPTNSFVVSDYFDAFSYNQIILLTDYTKGNTTALILRPEFSINGDAASPTWYVPVSAGSVATTGSTSTVTVNRVQYRYVHSGTLTTDIDNYAIELPINTPFFRVQARVAVGVGSAADPIANDTLTGSPSVTISAYMARI